MRHGWANAPRPPKADTRISSAALSQAGTPTQPARRRKLLLVGAILALAAALRLVIALLKDAANDDHLRVGRLRLAERRGPMLNDCRECFHPKLYHSSIALLVRALGMATDFWQRWIVI